ncbi:nucleotide disphospho-sugar-binding domain-containing protein [Catenuloplanes indicus]|uniref:UDP:flavonoid glycosyltransferase YjiC (YdhE family) n=1 Tax=Catenuloplanes indicus TaxID=137267 RepID=A0AAE3VVB6_9ACTN|nr:nucleotide disphospho-sugar-binding domain-containing protein [Catenuloplanes indicus]MDQ0364374.1 UDP:flavonoid glycosyltransferase YjiC (YdhE family) [Catenuloplanes indicus]
MIQIAGYLVRAGHDVTFVGGERFTAAAEAVGATMRPLAGAAAFDDRRLAEVFPERATVPPGPAMIAWDVAHLFGDAIPDQHATLQELLAESPDAVVLTDVLFLGPLPSVHGVGVRPRRWIGVGITPVFYPSDDATPFGPAPAPEGTDPVEATRAMNAGLAAALADASRHVVDLVEGLGGTGFTITNWWESMYTMPDTFVQLTVPEFEFDRSDLPDGLITFTGPLPAVPVPDWTPPSWWSELDGDRPVVVVTQGTVANGDLSELIAPTLEALADQDVLVVAALGRPVAELPGEIPANARVERYVPFDALLPRADVFVTNGGYGATQAALAAGVPIVVAGQTEDKPAVAARVGLLGVGVDLRTQTPKPDHIADAVRTVLDDPGYRDRVQRVRQGYLAVDGPRIITDLVTAAAGGTVSR